MPFAKKKSAGYPSASTVRFDYGYKMGVLQELRHPNKAICGYCRRQAVTNDKVIHKDDCPCPKEERQ